jgi:hypothetical protein
MTIDLSADPPSPGPATIGMPRRQLLLAGLCGLAGAAWTILSIVPDRLNPAAGTVVAFEPAEARGQFVDLATVGPGRHRRHRPIRAVRRDHGRHRRLLAPCA